jgi:cyclophilin family peptidyl-prolyl cis-trans isomerase
VILLAVPARPARAEDAPVPAPSPEAEPEATRPAPVPDLEATVVVTDFGEFTVRLDVEAARNAAALFLSLAQVDAFDGLAFHRVVPRLLIQTGDPRTRDDDPANDGDGAPPWRLPPEPAARTHARGTVSLAWRDDDPASAGMQWFVTLSEVPALDGRATPFGEVVRGLDVVDRIAQVSTFRDGRPLRPVRIEDVRLAPPPAAPPDTTLP